MSIEARSLAERINNLDLSAEKSKDSKVYEEGKTEYENIKRKITWILPAGLREVENYLNDNGRIVHERFFKKIIDDEIKNQGKRK